MPHSFARLVWCALIGATCLSPLACRSRAQDQEAEPRPAELKRGPTITAATTKHDFGRVEEGQQLQHVFTIKNEGDEVLEIEHVRSSCGCTAAVVSEKKVPPGGSTEVEVKFDTSNRKGKNHKVITITSNAPESKRFQLSIDADVIPILQFEPYFARLTAHHGEKVTTAVWLSGTLAPTAKPKIDQVTGTDAVKAELIEEQRGDGVRRGVRLTLEGKAVGSGRGVVHVTTGVEKKPKVQVRFSYNVQGNLKAPAQIYLDPSRESLRERTFKITSTRPGFVLKAARVDEGPFHATLAKAEEGFEVTVTATPPADQKGTVRGRLTLVSNDPVEPEKNVRLTLGWRGDGRGPSGRPHPPLRSGRAKVPGALGKKSAPQAPQAPASQQPD